MSGRHQKLADLRRRLEDTGLPYSIEHRKKHVVVSLNGKQIGVLPLGKKLATEQWGDRGYTFIERALRKVGAA